MAETVSPGRTPRRASAEASRRTRCCNSRYLMRRSPWTTATRFGWIAAVRGRNEIGVSGAKLALLGFRPANGLARGCFGATGCRFFATAFRFGGLGLLSGLRVFPAAGAALRLIPLAMSDLPMHFDAIVFR